MSGVTEESLLAQGVRSEHVADCVHTLTECGMETRAGEFSLLEAGMTNTSYLFRHDGTRYLMRFAGKGTGAFIDRAQEYEVYRLLHGADITDHVVFFDAATGTKVTEFVENARPCDAQQPDDVRRCMEHLRRFHEYSLAQNLYSEAIGEFDLIRKLGEYERALKGDMSVRYPDYQQVRAKAEIVGQRIEKLDKARCLCHIDPVADNFLVTGSHVRLIDWEYAEMADPHLDIAMFCIYSGLGREQIDEATAYYCGAEPTDALRAKIYAYCGLAGLLWTVWCELRREAGSAYDDYQDIQYSYPRRYFDFALAAGL